MRETQEVVARWNDATKAANRLQWGYVEGGFAPTRSEAVDCAASEPGFDRPCHNKPAWVLEDYHGYYPTCHTHMGRVSLDLASQYDDDTSFSVVYHRYKGV